MSVFEADLESHTDDVAELFRDYHGWMKQGILKSVSGQAIPVEEIDHRYDVEEAVTDDIAYLSDPNSGGRLFLAQENDELAGCVCLYWRSDDTAEVKRLYVRPAARGHGLGRSLMEAVIDAAHEDECETLLLFAVPFTEAAISLYEGLGFEHTSAFDCEAPEEMYEELVFMRLELGGDTS